MSEVNKSITSKITTIAGRRVYLYECGGSAAADAPLLIQPVDDHDLEGIDSEVSHIMELTENAPFTLAAFKVNDWNTDLSPWEAPAVFGNEGFGSGAQDTLGYILNDLIPEFAQAGTGNERRIILGGYSLAGFFSLWAGYQTDAFAGIAAASPSVWFPGWMDVAENRSVLTDAVYLSLGDKEERTRNPVMRTVGDNIRRMDELLQVQTGSPDYRLSDCILEMNQGNHFREPDLRTAKGFAWLINKISR